MKTIEPVVIWSNGDDQTATLLNVFCSYDSLSTYADFSFALLEVTNTDKINALSQGGLTMNGTDYQNWQTNDFAYDWVASKLKLTITGEYVPPTPPEPTPIVKETIA
jgi:hypothetical protein